MQIVSRVLDGVVFQEGGLPARMAAKMAALPGGAGQALPPRESTVRAERSPRGEKKFLAAARIIPRLLRTGPLSALVQPGQ